MTQQTYSPPPARPIRPWEMGQITYVEKLIAMLFSIPLVFAVFFFVLTLLIPLETSSDDDQRITLIIGKIIIGIFAIATLYIFMKLWPVLRATTRFKPTSIVAANQLGSWFNVQFPTSLGDSTLGGFSSGSLSGVGTV